MDALGSGLAGSLRLSLRHLDPTSRCQPHPGDRIHKLVSRESKKRFRSSGVHPQPPSRPDRPHARQRGFAAPPDLEQSSTLGSQSCDAGSTVTQRVTPLLYKVSAPRSPCGIMVADLGKDSGHMNSRTAHNIDAWHIGWGFTACCNMSCAFCYSAEARTLTGSRRVSTAQSYSFCERYGEAIRTINFGTGESFCSPEFISFIRYLRSRFNHLRLSVTTNGTLSRVIRVPDQLNELFDEVDISIDFADAAHHNKFRGVDWAFDAALATLDLCHRANVKASVVMLGLDSTLDVTNLAAMLDLARDHDACLRINLYRPVVSSGLIMPTYKAVMSALAFLHSTRCGATLSDPLFAAMLGVVQDAPLDRCGELRILPDGTITPSTYLVSQDWKGASLLDDADVLEAFRHSHAFDRFRNVSLPQQCTSCPHARTCRGGCIDRRWLLDGHCDNADPYCPSRNNDPEMLTDRRFRFPLLNDGPSVHTSYMPTMIFGQAHESIREQAHRTVVAEGGRDE